VKLKTMLKRIGPAIRTIMLMIHGEANIMAVPISPGLSDYSFRRRR
jgi:hypothetical protein